jgi:hypothetical protein
MGRIQDGIGQPLQRTLPRLRYDLVMIGPAAAVPLPETFRQRLEPLLARVAETAADYLRSGEALASRRAPPPLGEPAAALDGYADAFAGIRREGLTLGLPVDTAERIFTLGVCARTGAPRFPQPQTLCGGSCAQEVIAAVAVRFSNGRRT